MPAQPPAPSLQSYAQLLEQAVAAAAVHAQAVEAARQQGATTPELSPGSASADAQP